MKIIEHNATTGEITERDMTPEELAQKEADRLEAIAIEESKLAQAQTTAALLDRLGITEEEAKLLLS